MSQFLKVLTGIQTTSFIEAEFCVVSRRNLTWVRHRITVNHFPHEIWDETPHHSEWNTFHFYLIYDIRCGKISSTSWNFGRLFSSRASFVVAVLIWNGGAMRWWIYSGDLEIFSHKLNLLNITLWKSFRSGEHVWRKEKSAQWWKSVFKKDKEVHQMPLDCWNVMPWSRTKICYKILLFSFCTWGTWVCYLWGWRDGGEVRI